MLNARSLLLSFCCFIVILALSGMKALAEPVVVRLAGSDRYETSINISKNNWQQSDYIVLASGENFPDALCAAPLAKKYNAPILLAQGNSISNDVIQEIKRLGAKYAIIVGGTGVLSLNIESQLQDLNISYTRVQGKDRYETSVNVAKLVGGSNGIIITSGDNFPDALSIASIAAEKQMPIILSPAKSLPQCDKDYILGNSTNQIYIVGGSGVISDAALSGISNYKRLCGSNRYDTNLAVIKEFIGDIDTSNIYLATGETFPDALSGSAAAAKDNSIVILTNNVDCAAQSIVQSNMSNISSLKVLGGVSRVSDQFIQRMLNNKLILGYSTYYFTGDNSSYDSLQTNSNLINEIATDTFTTDGLGNLTGSIPTSQVAYANSKNIKTYAMITNDFDGDITETLLESSVNRHNLISNLLGALKANNYKGVNVDLEGIYSCDRDYFTTFMKELYTALHAEGFTVTAAVPAKTRDVSYESWTWAYNYSEIGNYSDQVVIMAYDEHYFGGEPGPIASIGWVQSVVNYTITAIPKEKVLLGIAGYGYDWSPSGTKAYGVGQAYNIASQYGATVKWDSSSQSPYFNYTDKNGVAHSVWFENSTSIGYKLDIVNKDNLLGIALWRLGLENGDYWTTIKNKFGS